MKKLSLSRVTFNAFLAFFIGALVFVATASPVAAYVIGGLIFASGFAVRLPGFAMALQTEVWVRDISENLFEGAEFLQYAMNDDAFVTNKIVHLPISGSTPTVQKDRSSLPATISQRTDTENTYTLSEYTTDPIVITDLDEIQVSYNKRQNVLMEHTDALNESIGNNALHSFAPSGSAALVLRTTGANTATLPNATATGTRLRVTLSDIARCSAKLDKDLVPRTGRVGVMPVDMYYELFDIDQAISKDYTNGGLPEGVISRLYNFDLMLRPSVVLYNGVAAGVLKAVGAAEATTDCSGAIFWQRNAVRRAKGGVKVFAHYDDPKYYGSVFSAMVLFGSKNHRTDFRGIVALAQGVGA